MRSFAVLIAASVTAAVVTGPASAATGRLLVPGKTATTSSPVAQIDFSLPSSWQQVRGLMAGTPSVGSYEIQHHPPGVELCAVRITLTALADRRPPVVRRGIVRSAPPSRWLSPLDITRTGSRAGVRWWTGRMEFSPQNDTAPAGAAAARIPKALAPAGRGWAVVGGFIGFRSDDRPAAREACASFAYYDQRTALRDALASVRVVARTS